MDCGETDMSEVITNEQLHRAILFGADCVRQKRDELNRINVYPVIDNDTGSNLSHTMLRIIQQSKLGKWIRVTLRDVARAALMGARGNSGAIFSQYFSGLYKRSPEKANVDLHELAKSFKEAYQRAYEAIEKPVEGTIITLMRAWSVSFNESLSEGRPLREHFGIALEKMHVALEDTRTTLKENRRVGVVDAGALGFYYFMDGFVRVMTNQQTADVQSANVKTMMATQDRLHLYADESSVTYRYCTEALFEADHPNMNAIKKECHALGDSLLVTSADTLHRIHVHTDEPWKLIGIAASFGEVLEQKADDMVMQNILSGTPENSIACVTDSVADLPQEYVYNHRIFQLPINILIAEVSYLDKRTIDRDFLLRNIGQASSAQPNTEQVAEFLRPILDHFSKVLILTVSSKMSGTHARIEEALDILDPDRDKSALIDTKVNSGAQGLLVRHASKMIEKNLPLKQIVSELEEMKTRAKITVSVLDIKPMATSGRVSERIGKLLITLGFKPLVSIDKDGNGTIRGIAFSEKRNWKILLKSLRGKKIEEYAIVHADNTEKAEQLADEMRKMTGKDPVYICTISSVVTLFAGKGAIAAAYIESPGTR